MDNFVILSEINNICSVNLRVVVGCSLASNMKNLSFYYSATFHWDKFYLLKIETVQQNVARTPRRAFTRTKILCPSFSCGQCAHSSRTNVFQLLLVLQTRSVKIFKSYFMFFDQVKERR